MRNRLSCIFALLFCSLLAFAAEPDWRNTKMLWAHYVGWGFNHVKGFDENYKDVAWQARPFTDRALYGRNLQDDCGIWESPSRQIRSAIEFGFDGFCIDVFKNFSSTMSRFFHGAQGTNFKIALCVDGGFTRENLVKELEDFIRKYENHPNACRIDGKMVIFIYTLGTPLDVWKAALEELDKKGCHAFYLAKPMHESKPWNNIDEIKKRLELFDGIYDFGCNGFFYDEQMRRYVNVNKAIKAYKPDALFCAGVTPGYLGHTSGYYRPFQNSGTLRDNWNVAMKSNPHWVCVTTWNDYIEHTHFEPSSMNRTALARLNLEYLREWRGEEPPPRQPLPIITYHEEVVMGADFTIDAVCGKYTTAPMTLQGRILDLKGKELLQLKPFTPDAKKIDVAKWRVTSEQMQNWRDGFRLQWALTAKGDKPVWREFQPVAIRYGHRGTLRSMRLAWDELGNRPKMNFSLRRQDGKLFADVLIKEWNYAGTIEVFRNGWPVAELQVAVQKAPQHKFSLPIEAAPAFGEDFYFVRCSGVSDNVAYSTPVILREIGEGGKVRQPVIYTGCDFDENWPIWSKRVTRYKENRIQWVEMDRSKLMEISYDFSKLEKGEGWVRSDAWQLSCCIGARHWNWFSADEESRPKLVEVAGPKGENIKALRFDGKHDTVALASRAMPYGAFTLEMMVRPEGKFTDTILFDDVNAAAGLSIDANGKVVATRHDDKPVVTPKALQADKWYHLALVYDGKSLTIFVNGEKAASGPAAIRSTEINSLPNIGSASRLEKSFSGCIKAFRLAAGVTVPEEFKLR